MGYNIREAMFSDRDSEASAAAGLVPLSRQPVRCPLGARGDAVAHAVSSVLEIDGCDRSEIRESLQTVCAEQDGGKLGARIFAVDAQSSSESIRKGERGPYHGLAAFGGDGLYADTRHV